MNRSVNRLLLVTGCIYFLTSCSWEKRKYLSGYHVEWSNKKPACFDDTDPGKKDNFVLKEYEDIKPENHHHENVSASSEKINYSNVQNTSDLFSDKLPGCSSQSIYYLEDCDILKLKNGQVIKIKVIELGDEEIKYRNCENKTDSVFAIKKYEIFSIQFTNGTVAKFKYTNQASPAEKSERKTDLLGVAGLIISLLGPVWGFLGLVFGIISIVRINKNPDKYKGIGFGIAAISIIILQIILILVFFGFLNHLY